MGALLNWALGLSLHFSPYSWASTSALWAGWPMARLPTPSSSPRQTVGTARWAWSAWAPGRTSRSAGTPTASACEVRPPLSPLASVSPLTHSLTVLPSLQTWPADAAMASWAMGPACAMGSCWMYWPLLPTSPSSMGYPGARGVVQWGSLWREPTHNPVSHHPQMLLGYANATPRGLEFLDFLDDERTYKTLFVPVDEGFTDNTVTGSVGSTGPDSARCAWSTTAVLCPQTLSGPDLELHASNTTFLSTNASQGALLPAHSGLSLIIGNLGPGNSSRAPEVSLEVAPALLAQPSLIITGPDSSLPTGPRGRCGQPRHRVGHPGLQWHHPHSGQPPAGAPAGRELSVDRRGGVRGLLRPGPSRSPCLQRAVVAPEAPPVAVGVGAVVAAGAVLGLVAGALYFRGRSRSTGFGFSAFQVAGQGAEGGVGSGPARLLRSHNSPAFLGRRCCC